MRGASELRHADEDDVLHAVAHILMESGNSLPQIAEQVGKLALHAAFIHMMIPAFRYREKPASRPKSDFGKARQFASGFFLKRLWDTCGAVFRLIRSRDRFS